MLLWNKWIYKKAVADAAAFLMRRQGSFGIPAAAILFLKSAAAAVGTVKLETAAFIVFAYMVAA